MFVGARCTMDQGADTEDTLLPASSLWVVVSSGARSESFELDGERRRALVVGSCIDADIRITGVDAAPVECFFVRDGDEIRLVPASATSDVFVGAVNVLQPLRLWRRTVIEIAGVALDVRVREEPPTAPDNEVPYLALEGVGAPDERAKGSPGAWPDQEARELDMLLKSEQGLEPSSDDGSVSVRRILSIESHLDGPTRTSESVQPSAPWPGVDGRSQWNAGVVRRRNPLGVPSPDLSTQDAPSHGFHGSPTPPSGPLSGFVDSPPSSTAPAMVSVRGLSRAPAAGLEQLGLLAQRRPLLVAAYGAIGATAIAVVLHLGASALGIDARSTLAAPIAAARLLSPEQPLCSSLAFDCTKVEVSRRLRCGCTPLVVPVISDFWAKLVHEQAALDKKVDTAPTATAPIEVVPVPSGQ